MSDNHIDVAYIANLAKLNLSAEQTAEFTEDLVWFRLWLL